jgi:hypothetical protein
MMQRMTLLGLSVVAVMAMGAVAASGALAAAVHAETYPATLSGKQTNENVLSNGVRTVSCEEAALTGTLTEASETITISPTYSKCKGNSGTVAEVKTTGVVYHLTLTTGTFPTGFGFHIKLTGVVHIKIWASQKAKEEAPNTTLCELEVPETGNTEIKGGEAMNLGSGSTRSIQLHIASENVLVKRASGTAANCGAAEKTNGTYNGELNGTASKGGVQEGLFLE